MAKADRSSSKLLQEPHVAVEQLLNVVKPVREHSQPIYAHAKRKATHSRRVVAFVAHELEDVGINHAAAAHLDPARLLADAASFAAADEARHRHFRAGLGKRKERWLKAGAHIRAKQRLHRVIERALQV